MISLMTMMWLAFATFAASATGTMASRGVMDDSRQLRDRPLIVTSSSAQMLENTPQLRIHGTGYLHSDVLEFLPVGSSPAPVQDAQFHVKLIDGSGAIIELLPEQRWTYLPEDLPSPHPLILTSVHSAESPDVNRLEEPVIVAMLVTQAAVDMQRAEKKEKMRIAAENLAAIHMNGAPSTGAAGGEAGGEAGAGATDSSKYTGSATETGVRSGAAELHVNNLGDTVKVYQSALLQSIFITGTGFPTPDSSSSGSGSSGSGSSSSSSSGSSRDIVSVELDPPLRAGKDYSLEIKSSELIVLTLLSGQRWRGGSGHVVLKSMGVRRATTTDGGAGDVVAEFRPHRKADRGIWLAKVLPDPTISTSNVEIHQSQSTIEIKGNGFTTASDMKVVLTPTSSEAYRVISVHKNIIKLQLNPGHSWVPWYIPLTFGDSGHRKVPISVVGVDTGAGFVTYPAAVTIGRVVPDNEVQHQLAAATARSDSSSLDARSTTVEVTGIGLAGNNPTFDISSLLSAGSRMSRSLHQGQDFDVVVQRDDKVVVRLSDKLQWEIAPKQSTGTSYYFFSFFGSVLYIVHGVIVTVLLIALLLQGYIFYARCVLGMPLSMAPRLITNMLQRFSGEMSELFSHAMS